MSMCDQASQELKLGKAPPESGKPNWLDLSQAASQLMRGSIAQNGTVGVVLGCKFECITVSLLPLELMRSSIAQIGESCSGHSCLVFLHSVIS